MIARPWRSRRPGDGDDGLGKQAEPLSVEGVTVRFGGVTALDDVSFVVEPRTVHAIIGPNGAGKSSCFNVLCGVYRASAGCVRLGNVTLSGRRPYAITRLGVGRTFQNIALSPAVSVMDNLMLARHRLTRSGFVRSGLRLPSVRSEDRRHRERVQEIAAFVGISDVLDVPAGLLPYGQQKRVELTRALCLEPRLLMLDEPVAGLNAEETSEMASTILSVRDDLGVTVLLVEHDMGLVMTIADRVTVLDFGRLLADGPPASVQRDPAVIRAYLGTGREDDAELAAEVVTSSDDAVSSTRAESRVPQPPPTPDRPNRSA